MERKTGATGPVKRKRKFTAGNRSLVVLNRKVNRISKGLRSNASRMEVQGLATAFPNISTTGTIYSLSTNISQGSDFYQRLGNEIRITRLNVRGVLRAGSSATSASNVRITVFRARDNLTFASNMTGSYNPLLSSVSTQVGLCLVLIDLNSVMGLTHRFCTTSFSALLGLSPLNSIPPLSISLSSSTTLRSSSLLLLVVLAVPILARLCT